MTQCERLFTEHFLSRSGTGYYLRWMQRMWRRQQYGINSRICEHGSKVVG
jgi:hypothetical protein